MLFKASQAERIIDLFDESWSHISKLGWCDGLYGAEYYRVFHDWIEHGCPPPISFIRLRANSNPFHPEVVTEELISFETKPEGESQ